MTSLTTHLRMGRFLLLPRFTLPSLVPIPWHHFPKEITFMQTFILGSAF